jgi:hypothetical protein
MSRDPSTGALTPEEHRLAAAAERDLDRLLSIQPSPEFAAKVRIRIAADSAGPAGWRFRWVALAAAGAFVIVLAAVLTVATVRSKPDVTAGVEPMRIGAAGEPAPSSAPAGAPVSQAERRAMPPLPAQGATRRMQGAAHRSPRIEVHGAAPEVLFDPQRRDALDRLLTMVHAGVTGLPVTSPEAQDLTVAPVVVKELEVPLLRSSAGTNEVDAARR